MFASETLSYITQIYNKKQFHQVSEIVILSSFEFFSIRISVRISDRSKVTQNKINFVKNCPQWGLNSQPLDHQSRALPTVPGRNLLEISEVSFLLFHAPLHMLDIVYF